MMGFGRVGVSHRLTAGLMAITLLTVLAAGVALYGVDRFRDGFDRIAKVRVGDLVGVARLAQHAQAIAVTAPRLAATIDRFERERAMRHLDDLFGQLTVLFDELPGLDRDTAAVQALLRYRQEFIDNLRRLDRLVGDRHTAEQRLRERLEAVNTVGRDARAVLRSLMEDTDRRFEEGGDPHALYTEVRVGQDWLAAFDEGVTSALVGASAANEGALDRLIAAHGAAMGRTALALERLPAAAASHLRPVVGRLAQAADAEDGVFATRLALLVGQRQIQGALNRITTVSGQFVAASSNLFVDARTAVEKDRAEFAVLMDRGAELLIALVLVSLIAAGLVVALLRRRVIARLLELQRCMRARADGYPVPIPVEGNDELADMAAAFAFFAREIDRREADLRAAKEQAERALDDLREAQDQLVSTEKLAALGGLVAGVAHEINTPIGVALTGASFVHDRAEELQAQVLEGRLKRSEFERGVTQLTETCRRVLSNIERAASLIQSFKQVAVDQTSGDRRRFQIGRYIGDVAASLEPKLRSANVRVRVLCPQDVEIDNHPGVLSQILTNLIMNSLTHAFPAGEDGSGRGGTVEIAVGAEGNGQIALRVSDDGQGMTPDVLARVFDPFFTTRRGSGGTGLGLHIVHNLVSKSLGGRITVTSTPGAGTSFSLRFPADAPAAADTTAEPA
ncbi:hypothetical protein HL658_09535 [Azospirillum sp. RWY-5-1]|uniref:histidine kinase n=1 Tax=Azospirillum oleiclasticum TaxID=2735135 RepID=A0ABX2T6J7_9PROT|nr:ATP-binding protein [Azospirillum oleiclasticum]NYZ12792.1 hypothetical protein [Azospirillum oleiclasticum]NYZ19952.1 hypothetical protein [Azospirillum oleiclasticum]